MRMSAYKHTHNTLSSVILGIIASWVAVANATPLDDYVARPDPNYTWKLRKTITGTGYKGYVIDMKSQVWRSLSEVNRNLWQHWVIIIKPNTVTTDKALLIIDGGSNSGSVPSSVDSTMASTAVALGTVIVDVQQIPNEPLTFAGESSSRTEDAIIAYSWDKYLRNGDPNWPLQLPMTKAVVRAMDTIQTFCASSAGGYTTINQFIVGGASKRGWTTWLTGAVDSRVCAIAPIVIDVLNVEQSLMHHYNSYGFWAPAVHDYVAMGIMNWMGTPQLTALMDIVDPYVYRSRLTMPKYVINAGGDQFFHCESSQFYWNDLPEPKHLRYVANTDHSMTGMEEDVGFAAATYYQSIQNNWPMPQFSWTFETDGSIRIQTVTTPSLVRMWQATDPNARDFRLEKIGAAYTSTTLTDQGGGVYIARVPKPAKGWTAFFAELHFNCAGSVFPYKFSTQIRVIPEPAKLNLSVVNETMGSVSVDPNLPKYYDPNAVVTLTATPVQGKYFGQWEIADANHPDDANYVTIDANTTLRLRMDADRQVTAVFKCSNGAAAALPLLLVGLAGVMMLRRRG